MTSLFGVLVATSCGASPPPPPRTLEPPRIAAEESCASATSIPALPAAPVADPYRLSHPALMIAGGTPVTFLCDLPAGILGIAATQTVDGGKRVVGGRVIAQPRAAFAGPATILSASAGCTQGALACSFATDDPALGTIEMLRVQELHTSGWVHGANDLCRALPDDTIAVCSTTKRMAYVELGCDGRLALGLHDTSLPRAFDLDVEVPVARLAGSLDPASAGAAWRFDFARDEGVTGPAAAGPARASLRFDLATGQAELVLDGATEPCWAFAISRR